MRTSKRELNYAMEHFNEVHHTTLNPEGPGVVRIHLVPPKIVDGQVAASVAIINGQDVIPVNRAWSILLAEFIEEVNVYAGREINDEDVQNIVKLAVSRVKKVYPFVPKAILRKDILRMMTAFKQVAYGEPTDESIGYLNIGEYAKYMKAPHRMDLMVSAMTKDGKWHCNQNCVHCYAAGQEQSAEAELSTEDWKAILDKCRAFRR